MHGTLPQPAKRAARYGEKDVWGIFTPLALQHKAVNLGQGFPNIPAPDFIKDAASRAISQDLNQYAPSRGLPRLRQALAKAYSPLFERSLDADSQVLVTQGANQGIAVTMQAFIEPQDEVILIEPFFDIYKPCVEVVGGAIRTVPLRLTAGAGQLGNGGLISSANEWKLDLVELESKITPRTKAIMLNNPHNPTGKLFTREELEQLAAVAIKHNLLVFSDEVYDRLYYEGTMERIATIPGMWERTITFGSGGKTFGVTGWRIGWIVGPEHLLKYILAIHARTVFTTPTPLQEAVAVGLETTCTAGNDYFAAARQEYQGRRDKAIKIFTDLGLSVAVPHGSYFFMVETSKIHVELPSRPSEEEAPAASMNGGGGINVAREETRDYALCRWLTTELGVTAIPPSAFYQPENKHLAENLIRVCFCKSDEILDAARERLQRLKPYIIK